MLSLELLSRVYLPSVVQDAHGTNVTLYLMQPGPEHH